MGGDLNLKKSWHPHLAKNQERVWKEEKRALEERKLIEKLNKEREEERAIEELQKLQEAHGGTKIQKRVDWMYQGPGANEQVTEEREAYLLGKRRIDNLLKASDETQGLKKGAAVGVDAFTGGLGAGVGVSASDTKKKVLEDPLLMIQKSKMEAQIKAAREAQKMEKLKERREKERSKKHRHHRRDRSRSDDEEDRSRHKRSRRDKSRSRSDSDDYNRWERRRRRSRSPRRKNDCEDRGHRRHRSRSRSPYRSRRDDDRKDFRRRSRSPRRSSDYYERPAFRRRSPSPRRKSYGDERPAPRRRSTSPKPKNNSPRDDDKAAKLAAMQADATSLEAQRLERVRLREIEDAAEEAKHKQDRDGGHRFISKIRRGAGEGVDLGDALARGRRGGAVEV